MSDDVFAFGEEFPLILSGVIKDDIAAIGSRQVECRTCEIDGENIRLQYK